MTDAIARAIGFMRVRPFAPGCLYRLIAAQLDGEPIATRGPRR